MDSLDHARAVATDYCLRTYGAGFSLYEAESARYNNDDGHLLHGLCGDFILNNNGTGFIYDRKTRRLVKDDA
jgi:hypothetical protein